MTFEEEFDLFYYGDGDGGYPRKQDRGDARKAFKAARKIASLEEIVEGRKRYAKHVEGWEKKWIKLPGGWLRGERWDDDLEEATSAVAYMSYDERREYGRRLMAKKTDNVYQLKEKQNG